MSRNEVEARPDFGLDAPPIVYGYTALGIVGVVLLVVAAAGVRSPALVGWGIWALVLGVGVAGLRAPLPVSISGGLATRPVPTASSAWPTPIASA